MFLFQKYSFDKKKLQTTCEVARKVTPNGALPFNTLGLHIGTQEQSRPPGAWPCKKRTSKTYIPWATNPPAALGAPPMPQRGK